MSTTGNTHPIDMSIGAKAALVGTLTFCTMLYAMTVTIASVALPRMQGAMGATTDQIAWVVTFNLVATAVATPTTGWLVAKFGQRRLMMISVLGFAAASLGCGMATSLEQLVMFRMFQGLFGAPIVPTSQSIVLRTFTPAQQPSVMAVFGMGVVMGPILAPTIGGFLAEEYGWRWVFFMVVPIAGVAFAGVVATVRDNENEGPVKLDWTGFIALSLAVAATQLALDRGERNDWFESPEIVIEVFIAALALYIFIAHGLTHDRPFLNFKLFKDRSFSFGILFAFVFGMLNFLPLVLLPPMLQTLQNYPESTIGWILATRGFGTLTGFGLMAVLSRFDPRIWLTLGFGLQGFSGIAMAQMGIELTSFDIAWISYLHGLGVGISWVPVTQIAFGRLAPKDAADASAVFNLLRNFGTSMFISICVAVVLRTSKFANAGLVENISPLNEMLRYPGVMGAWSLETLPALAAVNGEIARQATMIGYINAFYLSGIVSLLVIPLTWLVGSPKAQR